MERTEENSTQGQNLVTQAATPVYQISEKAAKQMAEIRFDNPSSLDKYGESTATILNNMSQGMSTNEAKLKSMGEVGERITDLLKHTKELDAQSLLGSEKPGIIARIFNKVKDPIETFAIKHKSVSEAMSNVSQKLKEDRDALLSENNSLDRVYEENLSGLGELEDLIAAGLLRLAELKAEFEGNKERISHMEKGSLDYDKEFLSLQEQQNFIDRFEQRIDRLNGSRAIVLRQLPQIRIMQHSNSKEAETIQDLVNTAIPVWEQQINLYISQLRTKTALENEQMVKTMLNDTIQANNEQMKLTAIEIAKSSTSSIIDAKTIISAQDNLLETVKVLQQAAETGRRNRADSFLQIMQLDKQLKDNIAPLNGGVLPHYGPTTKIAN